MIVAGFGFRAAASCDSLADALEKAGRGLAPTAFATADDKATASSLSALATRIGLPILAVDAEALARQETATRSPASIRARAAGSVAEAAALAAAGSGAKLLVERVISDDGMATCAIAIAKEDSK